MSVSKSHGSCSCYVFIQKSHPLVDKHLAITPIPQFLGRKNKHKKNFLFVAKLHCGIRANRTRAVRQDCSSLFNTCKHRRAINQLKTTTGNILYEVPVSGQ